MNRIILFLWLVCLATFLHAQTISDTGKAELDKYMQMAVTDKGIPGIVALVTNSEEIIYQSAFGKQDTANGLDMATDSIFRIASMTKPVTSVAVMMLVEQGKVGLDDPVEHYLPDLADREVFTTVNLEDGTYESVPAKNKMKAIGP